MVIGKPCEGKLHARFDEGMVETLRLTGGVCATILLYNQNLRLSAVLSVFICVNKKAGLPLIELIISISFRQPGCPLFCFLWLAGTL